MRFFFCQIDLFLFHAVTFYTLASTSCLISSQLNLMEKQKLIKLIAKHDDYVKKYLNVQHNYERRNKKLGIFFVFFWLFVVLSYCGYLVSIMRSYPFDPLYLVYLGQIEVPNHFIQMQGFQFIIFMYGIERRIEAVSRCNFSDNEREFRKAMWQICDIWKGFYECIGINLLIFVIQNNVSTIINLFWLGMAFMDVSYATFVGIYMNESFLKIHNFNFCN
jgi:hypothetical protein